MTKEEQPLVLRTLKELSDIIYEFVDKIMENRPCSSSDMVFLSGLQALADYIELKSTSR